MSEAVDSVRILSEAIELAEMLEILAQSHVGRTGEFPIAGVKLTLRQVTEHMRTVRADLATHLQRTAVSEKPKNETVVRSGSSLASRLKPAPTFSGRVRDISVTSGSSGMTEGHGAQ